MEMYIHVYPIVFRVITIERICYRMLIDILYFRFLSRGTQSLVFLLSAQGDHQDVGRGGSQVCGASVPPGRGGRRSEEHVGEVAGLRLGIPGQSLRCGQLERCAGDFVRSVCFFLFDFEFANLAPLANK